MTGDGAGDITTIVYVIGTGLTLAGLLGTMNDCTASVIWRTLYGWPDQA